MKKIPRRSGTGLKIPSLRWIREGQTLSAGGRWSNGCIVGSP